MYSFVTLQTYLIRDNVMVERCIGRGLTYFCTKSLGGTPGALSANLAAGFVRGNSRETRGERTAPGTDFTIRL